MGSNSYTATRLSLHQGKLCCPLQGLTLVRSLKEQPGVLHSLNQWRKVSTFTQLYLSTVLRHFYLTQVFPSETTLY